MDFGQSFWNHQAGSLRAELLLLASLEAVLLITKALAAGSRRPHSLFRACRVKQLETDGGQRLREAKTARIYRTSALTGKCCAANYDGSARGAGKRRREKEPGAVTTWRPLFHRQAARKHLVASQ
jgi:hypothetical protein